MVQSSSYSRAKPPLFWSWGGGNHWWFKACPCVLGEGAEVEDLIGRFWWLRGWKECTLVWRILPISADHSEELRSTFHEYLNVSVVLNTHDWVRIFVNSEIVKWHWFHLSVSIACYARIFTLSERGERGMPSWSSNVQGRSHLIHAAHLVNALDLSLVPRWLLTSFLPLLGFFCSTASNSGEKSQICQLIHCTDSLLKIYRKVERFFTQNYLPDCKHDNSWFRMTTISDQQIFQYPIFELIPSSEMNLYILSCNFFLTRYCKIKCE